MSNRLRQFTEHFCSGKAEQGGAGFVGRIKGGPAIRRQIFNTAKMLNNSTVSLIPAVREQFGSTFYYIPYQYGSLVGPEKLWDEDAVRLYFNI